MPNFVNENTLVIANSYSGNTEETLSALEKCQDRGSEIAVITSGGKLKDVAEENNYNKIIIPASTHIVKTLLNVCSDLFYSYGWTPISYINRTVKSKKDLANYLSIINDIRNI